MDMTGYANRPANVPADRVIDWDIYAPPQVEAGFHEAWGALAKPGVPDAVWTPRNGGHWIVTRGDLIPVVLSDYARFSSRVMLVPKEHGEDNPMIPTKYDPPEHRDWKRLLTENLSPRVIRRLESDIREISSRLIEEMRDSGECDFVRHYADRLPVELWLRLVDLPAEDAPRLKYLADQNARPDGSMTFSEMTAALRAYLDPVLESRAGQPGDDLISRIINDTVNGNPITREESQQICVLLLIAGLDTVVNMLSFVMYHLATHPEQRDALAANTSMIPQAANEILRRYSLVSTAREVRDDIEFCGVTMRGGDMIVAPTVLHGLDPQVFEDPLTVKFERRTADLCTFGRGSHRCPGEHIARTEVIITIEEWLRRVPALHLVPGTELHYRGGLVGHITSLPLAGW